MSATDRSSTAADRIRRGSPAVQPAAGRLVSGNARVKPYKLTVSLDPSLYEGLREWAHDERLSHQAVLQRLVRELLSNPSLATEIRNP